jgi:hypothetical protein
MSYQPKYTPDECRQVQLDPRMLEVYRDKDLKKSEKEFHLNNLWGRLQDKHQIAKPVLLHLHNRRFLPEGGSGLATVEQDHKAEAHIAFKDRPLFRALITMAHEYRHCYQMLAMNWYPEDILELEGDATAFSYDFVTDYCKEVFLNEQPA